jgi:hypothetical protein
MGYALAETIGDPHSMSCGRLVLRHIRIFPSHQSIQKAKALASAQRVCKLCNSQSGVFDRRLYKQFN